MKTIWKRNDTWWGNEGNLTSITYSSIKNDATRVAALISGEVDFILTRHRRIWSGSRRRLASRS